MSVQILAGPNWWQKFELVRAKHGDKGRFDKPHIFKVNDFWVATKNGEILAGSFTYKILCYDIIGWQK
jgi:hypothetical protein